VIDAVVDTNGNVRDMQPISGQRLLVLAAMDAVHRWKYQPTLLNGEPIPVIVRVTVTFHLKPSS
jgi:protein TonB